MYFAGRPNFFKSALSPTQLARASWSCHGCEVTAIPFISRMKYLNAPQVLRYTYISYLGL
jgi:hypothetical protein